MKKHLTRILCFALALLTLAFCCSCGEKEESVMPDPQDVEPVFEPVAAHMTDLAYVGGGLVSFKDAATGKLGLINSKGETVVEAEYSKVKYCAMQLFFVLTKPDGSECTYNPEDKSYTDGNLCAHGGPATFVWDAANQQAVYYEVDAYPVPEEDLPAEGKAEIIFDLNTRKVGLVGHDGKLIVEPIYDEGLPFANGVAAVKKDGKWGYVDMHGTVVVGFYYDDAYVGAACTDLGQDMPYDADANGMIVLNHDGLYGIYNSAGDIVCAFQYRDLIPFGDGNYAALTMNGEWKLGNIGGVSTPN